MPSIAITKEIEAPLDRVFATFIDFKNCPGTIDGIERIEMLTDGPVGVGTRFRETRTMFKREATEEMQIIAFEAPRSYRLGCDSCGARYETEFRFTADDSATRVDVQVTIQPLTFFAKLMSPLGWMMSGMLRKCVEKDIDDLKAALERSADQCYPAERSA